MPLALPVLPQQGLQPFEEPEDAPTWEGIVSFLESRRGQLDAVVFSGGEPTYQWHFLNRAMDDVRGMGFKVGLHTAGMFSLFVGVRCDWVGFDYKAPIMKYRAATGTIRGRSFVKFNLKEHLMNSMTVEVRTTWDSTILTMEDAAIMAREIAEAGAPSWTIQRCTGDMTDLEQVADMARGERTGMEIKVRG